MKHKTFAGHLIHGEFVDIFNHDIPILLGLADREAKALQDGWNKLEPQLQTSLVHASGVMDTIATNLDGTGAEVLDSILAKFTDLKVENLKPWLAKVQGVFTGISAIEDQDVEVTITNLQTYLKQYDQTVIGHILSVVSQVFAAIIKPGSLASQIATYMPIAYHTFVKPSSSGN